ADPGVGPGRHGAILPPAPRAARRRPRSGRRFADRPGEPDTERLADLDEVRLLAHLQTDPARRHVAIPCISGHDHVHHPARARLPRWPPSWGWTPTACWPGLGSSVSRYHRGPGPRSPRGRTPPRPSAPAGAAPTPRPPLGSRPRTAAPARGWPPAAPLPGARP